MASSKHIIRLDHIGIAVKDLHHSNDLFEALMGKSPYKSEYVVSENVMTSFFRAERSKIELLHSDDPENVINRFIEKRGEGIHHIAFLVKDIEASIQDLKSNGFEFINETPKKGADNKIICFLHPKSSNGVLIELCQSIDPEK
ncbi:MAG: methylmalonyl-CoA epimerase [Bacteroidia bacterium]|nr:methylmalonyl-CoA epimerase [Bacteroidia bacterium]